MRTLRHNILASREYFGQNRGLPVSVRPNPAPIELRPTRPCGCRILILLAIHGSVPMQLWQDVPYIPMGEYWQSTAYRRDLLDVLPGCFAVFWGIRRA